MGVGGMCFPQCGWSWESVWWSSRLCRTLSLDESQQPLSSRSSSVLENRENKPAYPEVVGGEGEARTCGTWNNFQVLFVCFRACQPQGWGGFPDCQGYREQLLSRILPTTGESRSSAGAKHPSGPNCKETLGGMAQTFHLLMKFNRMCFRSSYPSAHLQISF